MKYFKYISIILVTVWVVFYADSNAEDLASSNHNKLRMTYFQTKASIERNRKDIYQYKAQKLALMSNGDFKSDNFKKVSALLEKKERDMTRLMAIKKNGGSFSYRIPENFVRPTETSIINE